MIDAAKQSLRLLPARDRMLFGFAVLAQSLVGLLDLLGVVLLTATISVGLAYSSGTALPAAVAPLTDWAESQGWSLQSLAALTGIAAAGFLIAKSGLAVTVNRRVLTFLASRQRWISARLSRGLLGLPMQVLQSQPSQRWVYAATDGVNVATSSLLGGGVALVSEVVTIASLVGFLIASNPVLALLSALLFGGGSALLYARLSAAAHRAGAEAGRSSIVARAHLQECLESHRELTVYRRLDWPAEESGRLWGWTSASIARSTYLMQLPRYLLEILLVASVASVTIWSFSVFEPQRAIETVVLFLVAAGRIVPSLMRLQLALITVRTASGQAEPTYLLKAVIEDNGGFSDGPVETARSDDLGDIRACDVTFTYEEAQTPTLDGVTFHVPPGTFVAIVGPSGGGKSTLADVMLGLLEIQSGSIRIGDLRPEDAMDLYPGSVAYVPQSPALINGSVRSNVALGIPEPLVDDDLVWRALDRARIAHTVRELPAGLDTPIAEHGARLSGGQRQRLGIARALYASPSILVLDEATSALDAATEAEITEVLLALSGSITCVMVAHRLSTVLNADQVIYLDRGRVRAVGSFAEVRDAVPEFDYQARLSGM